MFRSPSDSPSPPIFTPSPRRTSAFDTVTRTSRAIASKIDGLAGDPDGGAGGVRAGSPWPPPARAASPPSSPRPAWGWPPPATAPRSMTGPLAGRSSSRTRSISMRPERTVIVPSVRSARSPPVTFRSVSRWRRPNSPSRTRKSSLVTRRSTWPTCRSARDTPAPPVTCSVWPSLSAIVEATHVDAVRLQADVGVDGREARPFVGQAERAVGDAQPAVDGRRRQRAGQVQVGVQRAGDLLDQRRERLRHAQVDGARFHVEIDGRGVAPRVVAQHGRRGQRAADGQPLGPAFEPGLDPRRLGIVTDRGVERLVGEAADLAVADREVRGRLRRQEIPGRRGRAVHDAAQIAARLREAVDRRQVDVGQREPQRPIGRHGARRRVADGDRPGGFDLLRPAGQGQAIDVDPIAGVDDPGRLGERPRRALGGRGEAIEPHVDAGRLRQRHGARGFERPRVAGGDRRRERRGAIGVADVRGDLAQGLPRRFDQRGACLRVDADPLRVEIGQRDVVAHLRVDGADRRAVRGVRQGQRAGGVQLGEVAGDRPLDRPGAGDVLLAGERRRRREVGGRDAVLQRGRPVTRERDLPLRRHVGERAGDVERRDVEDAARERRLQRPAIDRLIADARRLQRQPDPAGRVRQRERRDRRRRHRGVDRPADGAGERRAVRRQAGIEVGERRRERALERAAGEADVGDRVPHLAADDGRVRHAEPPLELERLERLPAAGDVERGVDPAAQPRFGQRRQPQHAAEAVRVDAADAARRGERRLRAVERAADARPGVDGRALHRRRVEHQLAAGAAIVQPRAIASARARRQRRHAQAARQLAQVEAGDPAGQLARGAAAVDRRDDLALRGGAGPVGARVGVEPHPRVDDRSPSPRGRRRDSRRRRSAPRAARRGRRCRCPRRRRDPRRRWR